MLDLCEIKVFSCTNGNRIFQAIHQALSLKWVDLLLFFYYKAVYNIRRVIQHASYHFKCKRCCQNTLLHMHLSSSLPQVSRSLKSAIRLANPGMPFRHRSELEARRNPQWRYRDTQVSGTPLVPRAPGRGQST